MSTSSRPIEGNVSAVVTPFDEAGELLLDDFVEIVRWHLANGADDTRKHAGAS